MNDLRSPSEDRPYHLSARPEPRSARLEQDDVDPEYGMTLFDRVRYSRWFPLASVFAAVLIFSGIVSYAYKQGSQTGVNATTPVVAADTKDYKEKPANPGGMDVPFQDAVVFDQLQNKGQAPADGKVESLLPPPEQPVANNATPAPATAPEAAANPAPAATPATPPVVANTNTPATPAVAPAATTPAAPAAATTSSTTATPSAVKAGAPVAPVAQTTNVAAAPEPVAVASEPAAAEAEDEEAPAAPAPQVLTKPAAPAKKAAAVTPKKVATATPVAKPVSTTSTASTAKVASGTYRIQLGAFRDEAAARAAWAKVAKQYSSLSSVTPAFPRADLGAKGIFYRAQGINLSKASADSLCSTINASKAGSCIVAH